MATVSRSRALAAAWAMALVASIAIVGLALTGCAATAAAPVESVKDVGGGRSTASVSYDGLTLTLNAPTSAVASAPMGVSVQLKNTSKKTVDLGGALIGVRAFTAGAEATDTVAFEAGLDASATPAVSVPAGGTKSVALALTAPKPGSYILRGVFGSSIRVKGNTTPALTLTVR